jgi:succinoglycan biosynthesis protein ExoM
MSRRPAEGPRPDELTRPAAGAGLRVRVAVLTYRRPDDLRDALPLLVSQLESVSGDAVDGDLVVVDNDPEAGAEQLVRDFARAHPMVPVLYEHESTAGIAAARNRALHSSADVDVLVFIDDDERPTEQWLGCLLQTYRTFRSAAVVGPVVSEFGTEPDPWITAGRFFVRLRRPTGSPVTVAATNNLLLDLHQIRRLGLDFDLRFGLSGGSDTKFTRELHQRGGRLIWCDEAVVTDVVPAARATRSWVLRRALRSGNGESTTSLDIARPGGARFRLRLRLSARGALRLAGGTARLVLGVATRSQGHQARGVRTCARGLGMLSGAWGYVYHEYRRKA